MNADGDSIVANLDVNYINGKKRSKVVTLIGNSKDNTIVGGSKADTINGFSGNNVLTGGKGKDLFIFDATTGSDTITDYTANQDSITVTSDNYSGYTVEDKDVIFSFTGTDNTLTIQNAKDKVITVNGVKDTYNNVHELILTTADNNKTFDLTSETYSAVTMVDGSKTTKSITVIANNNGNSIIGGKGADSITLGNGKDTVVYTSGYGNDTIKNYSADDVIQLGKNTNISKAQIVNVKDSDGNITSSNYVFTIGKNKLTVTDIDNKTITFVDEDDNEILYRKRSRESAYTEAWFLDNEECRMQNAELDSIINNDSKLIGNDYNYEVGSNYINKQINQTLTTNLTKQQNK